MASDGAPLTAYDRPRSLDQSGFVEVLHSIFSPLRRGFGVEWQKLLNSLDLDSAAVDAVVLYFQSTLIFPSWTSPALASPPISPASEARIWQGLLLTD
jgi:hypothetical protein